MARKKRSFAARRSNILPAWIWLTLGILIGLGISMVTRMGERYVDNNNVSTKAPPQNTKATAQSKKPKFDFYTLLPELEVVIPEEEKRPLNKKPVENNRTTSYTGGYLLQAGSFRKFSEADSLKARLALLGVQAHIQSVEVNNSKWHRVRIGPSNDRQALEKMRKQLRSNQVDTILMQTKQ